MTYKLLRIGLKVGMSVISLNVFGTFIKTKFFFSSSLEAQNLTEREPNSLSLAKPVLIPKLMSQDLSSSSWSIFLKTQTFWVVVLVRVNEDGLG